MSWLDDLQRRLAVAGARSLGGQVAGQVGKTFGWQSDDVWGTATAELADAGSAGYAPECVWCPVCRAIRMARESNPDLASRVGETAGALMSAAQDVVAAVDAALTRMPGQARTGQVHRDHVAAVPPSPPDPAARPHTAGPGGRAGSPVQDEPPSPDGA